MIRPLLDLNLSAFEEACGEVELPSYRARQVFHWVAERYVTDYDLMTNLPKDLRSSLAEIFPIRLPTVVEERKAPDGTVKFRLLFDGKDAVEAVRMPRGDRTTLCLSSQTGCSLGCRFCLTGLHPGRNLTTEEITGQFLVVAQGLSSQRINIVYMGMGEPLLNLENVAGAISFQRRSISPRRITVSTAGLLEGMGPLGRLSPHPRLAVSLNGASDRVRRDLMPLARSVSMDSLFEAMDAYPRRRGERVTLEMVLLKGINDGEDEALLLAERLQGRERSYKVNLIPYNSVDAFPDLEEPEEAVVQRYLSILISANLTVTVRRSHGREIGAACGQLTVPPSL